MFYSACMSADVHVGCAIDDSIYREVELEDTIALDVSDHSLYSSEEFAIDSVSPLCVYNIMEPVNKWYDSDFFHYTHVGASLIVLGCIEKNFDKKTRQLRNDFIPSFKNKTDNYLQVAPVFVLYGLKAAGIESKHSIGRMITSHAATVALMFPLTRSLKSLFKVQRPDSSRKNSFPSGHTTTAFMTATMLHKEYGYLSPWVTVGSYSCATATGFMRMANNRHWYSDVLCGAGIGMLTTEFGYWIGDLLFKDKGLNVHVPRHDNFDKYYSPSFLSIYTGINIPINKHFFHKTGHRISPTAGQSIGLEGAYYVNSYFGYGGKICVTNIDLNNDDDDESDNSFKYGQLMFGVYGNLPVTSRTSFSSKLLVGSTHFNRTEINDFVLNTYWGACMNTEVAVNYRLDTHFGTRFSFNYNLHNAKNRVSSPVINSISVGGNLIYHF